MTSVPISILYALMFIGLLRVIQILIKMRKVKSSMPPGPPGVAIFGNAFQMGSFQWLKFAEWKEQYGPIFSLNLAGQHAIVLNDFETATEFLDHRSKIYSDRPRFIMSCEIMSGGLAFVTMHSSELWRRMRRVAHEAVTGSCLASYQPMQEKGSALLAARLLQDPKQWNDHIGRGIASIMLSIIYGWSDSDSRMEATSKRILAIAHRLAYASIPGNYLVETFPRMLVLPEWLAKWKREGRACFKRDTEDFITLLRGVVVGMIDSTPDVCVAAKLLEDRDKHNLDEAQMAWLAATIILTGTETTAATLTTAILALVLHPGVVHKAQTQLDAIVGRDRFPTFDDRAQLPYIEAIIKEAIRWRPVGPVGLPRRSTQDDWYKGFFIPAGTLVIYNTWSINRDPKHFTNDAQAFRPERYLNEAGEIDNNLGQGHTSFGSGRRICVGKDAANQVLFITLATILWAFNIEKAKDASGEVITPPHGDLDVVDDGVVVQPKPFKCSITPRSPDVATILRSVSQDA